MLIQRPLGGVQVPSQRITRVNGQLHLEQMGVILDCLHMCCFDIFPYNSVLNILLVVTFSCFSPD